MGPEENLSGRKEEKKRHKNQDIQLTISDQNDEDAPKVNALNYRIDAEGNIVDKKGHLVFKHSILEPVTVHHKLLHNVEIPRVFREKGFINILNEKGGLYFKLRQ